VIYNKINMNTPVKLASVMLLLSLLVVLPCETVDTSSPYPSYKDVASIAEGTDPASLGIGTVPLGSDSSSGLSFDDNSLKALSDMINQILSGLNSTTPTTTSDSSDGK
jgi:hypothetical protein